MVAECLTRLAAQGKDSESVLPHHRRPQHRCVNVRNYNVAILFWALKAGSISGVPISPSGCLADASQMVRSQRDASPRPILVPMHLILLLRSANGFMCPNNTSQPK